MVKWAAAWAKDAGFSKLMTYVDTRLGGTGVGYERSGFIRSGITPPRFWWTDFTDRFNRFKYKANSSAGLSEAAVAEAAGVVKIWGCENVVYEMLLSRRP